MMMTPDSMFHFTYHRTNRTTAKKKVVVVTKEMAGHFPCVIFHSMTNAGPAVASWGLILVAAKWKLMTFKPAKIVLFFDTLCSWLFLEKGKWHVWWICGYNRAPFSIEFYSLHVLKIGINVIHFVVGWLAQYGLLYAQVDHLRHDYWIHPHHLLLHLLDSVCKGRHCPNETCLKIFLATHKMSFGGKKLNFFEGGFDTCVIILIL